MLHVEDLADLIEMQLHRPEHFSGETFNVGGGVELSSSLLELTEWCEKITGQSIPIHSDPESRPGDIPWFITDSRRIQNHSGWKPKRSLESIFEEIHHWIHSNQDQLRSVIS